MAVYRVAGPGTARSRFDVAITGGLTPLVGREEELGVLRRRWEQAKQWAGQAVLISGEAGIGKSRLVQTLKDQVIEEGATRIEIRCSPYHRHSALHPVIEHLERLLKFASNDTVQTKLAKLRHAVTEYHSTEPDTLPLLASLLSLPRPDDVAALRLNPQKQKQRIQEILVAWLVDETGRRPCTVRGKIYTGGIHRLWNYSRCSWIKSPPHDCLPCSRSVPTSRPPWGSRSYLSQVTLSRLDARHVEAMVGAVAGNAVLPRDVLRQIVAKTVDVTLRRRADQNGPRIGPIRGAARGPRTSPQWGLSFRWHSGNVARCSHGATGSIECGQGHCPTRCNAGARALVRVASGHLAIR